MEVQSARVVEPQAKALALAWLFLVAVLLGVTGWLFTSTLVSIAEFDTPDYLLVARPFSHLALWCLATLALVGAIQALCATRVFQLSRWQDGFSWPYVRPLSPILLLILPLAALGLLTTPLGTLAPPWLYLFIDLRWWLLLGIAALTTQTYLSMSTLRPFDPSTGSGSSRATSRDDRLRVVPSHVEGRQAQGRPESCRGAERGWGFAAGWLSEGKRSPQSRLWDLALALTLLVLAFAASPTNRFDSGVVGDEPKYLRYLENWYRGRGMDITGLVPIDELPVDYQPELLGNVRRAGVALRLIAGDLVADARRLSGLDAPPPPGPAYSKGGAFVEGKRGGVYQVHNPGVSLLLFPGYFVDRFVLNWTSPAGSQSPTHLYGTNLLLLSLYLLWGAGLFRLLESHTGAVGVSWLVACIAMLSLPATAFAYQYYPEVAGGLFFVFLVRYAVLSTEMRLGPAFWYGVMAGYLPWLHVRFGSAAVLAGVAVLLTRARLGLGTAIVFWTGLAIPMTALCLYSYHITGSLLPFKVWTLLKDELQVFNAGSFPRRLVGLWFDTDWGVVAHVPVYLLVIAGLWPMWQRSRRAAILVALFILSLAIPAAWHNWHGSGTTPLRLVAASVPLVALPLAAAVVHFRRSRWFIVLFSVLAIVSVQNGLTFNFHFDREWPVLRGPTFSGWLSRLALPNLNVGEPLKNPLLLAWVAVAAMLFLWPVLRRRIEDGRAGRSWTAVTATVLSIVATASSVAAAWTGDPLRTRFMLEPRKARDNVLAFYLAHPNGMAWSARRGPTSIERVFPNPDDVDVKVNLDTRLAPVLTDVPVSVIARGSNGAKGWGTVAVDFGDGRPAARAPFVGATTLRRAYSKPGEYQMSVTIAMPGAGQISRNERVKVIADELIAPYSAQWIGGLPPDVLKHPVSVAVERVTVGESQVELHGSATSSRQQLSHAEFWVWVIGQEGGNLRAHLYHARRVPGADSGADLDGTFTLVIAPTLRPEDGKLASVMVGMSPVQGKPVNSRSRLFSFDWPSPQLTIGSPIVVTAAEAR